MKYSDIELPDSFDPDAAIALGDAKLGETEHLARHIEAGGVIDDAIRIFLAAHLRGEIKRRPGNQRTASQIRREVNIAHEVYTVAKHFGVSRYRAAEAYLFLNPEINEETLKSYLKRHKDMAVRKSDQEIAEFARLFDEVQKRAGWSESQISEQKRLYSENSNAMLDRYEKAFREMG
ncbi:hypothetical protein [Croceicoccus naphthovorans]|uniref:Uncharacterized protein n=1 Tax=Croceicoccus naphthovorans TaxID=1348774 RepID=A0A0G3XFC6_9SPHN|nr:hypothetical protein [Croceicoccus naphthovorans]AKM09319.1 hypothetical protein AB433_03920 [Croceicoccus naphthovorans]MBB3990228.1 hypothetical protein [Croceicoccus naphthovorans]